MHWLAIFIAAVAAMGTLSSTIFLVLALIGARRFHSIARQQKAFEATLSESQLPFVSVLKPMHGLEPQLEENLESFFAQDYPEYEILLAVDTADDAALAVAQRVIDRHPNRTTKIVVNGEPPWPNPPAYSFFCMAQQARAADPGHQR